MNTAFSCFGSTNHLCLRLKTLCIMKLNYERNLIPICTTVCLSITLAAMARTKSIQTVTANDGITMIDRGETSVPLKTTLQLAKSIQVMTNATFTVDGGSPRNLEDGETLRSDGYLLEPNGSMRPVFDRLVKTRARAIRVYKDGKTHVLKQPLTLPSGIRVNPHGMLTMPDGSLHRMIEGQMLRLDNGSVLPAKDTVTMRHGVVYVQKEGDQFKLPGSRSIMMNNGTKVFGDGHMVRQNGTEMDLHNGETIVLPGVTF